jgi:hypothetical protein
VAGIRTIISQNLAISRSRSLFKDKRIHVSLLSLTRPKHSFEYKDVARPKWYKYSGFQIERERVREREIQHGAFRLVACCSNNHILARTVECSGEFGALANKLSQQRFESLEMRDLSLWCEDQLNWQRQLWPAYPSQYKASLVQPTSNHVLTIALRKKFGARRSVVIKTLFYEPEGRGIDT